MTTLHFFTDSYGPQPTSYYRSNFHGLARQIPLTGFPGPALREVLEDLWDRARQQGTPVEVIHRPLDNALQGLILPELSAGVYSFEPWDPQAPWGPALAGHPDLRAAREQLSAAHKTFARARVFHDGQEKIYGQHMDYDEATRAAESLAWKLVEGHGGDASGGEVHRFFGAATQGGSLDYVPQVTEDIPRRVFLKGRPGTGKSTLLKKVARAAREAGWDVEVYHCSLDPKSLDLVAVRQLGFCVLDSTAPHEYFPSRPGDEVLDLYARCVEPGTDEANWEDLEKLRNAYRALVQTATGFLREAQASLDRFYESFPQPEPQALGELRDRLWEQLCADPGES